LPTSSTNWPLRIAASRPTQLAEPDGLIVGALRFICLAPLKLAVPWLLIVVIAAGLSGESTASTWLQLGSRAALVFAIMYVLLCTLHAILWWVGLPEARKRRESEQQKRQGNPNKTAEQSCQQHAA
jgi:hypothetical protein